MLGLMFAFSRLMMIFSLIPFLRYKTEIIMIVLLSVPVVAVYSYYAHIRDLEDRNRKLYSELKLTLKEHTKLNKKYVRICEKYDVADRKYLKKLLPHLCNNCCVEQKKRLRSSLSSASSQTG